MNSRRRFLKNAFQAFAGMLFPLAARTMIPPMIPIMTSLSACGQKPLSSAGGTSGNTSSTDNSSTGNSSSNVYTFSFSDYPALQNPGGSIQKTVNATSGSKTVFITRVDANTVSTVSVVCTHAGCTLNTYDSNTQQYTCPCHHSVFSASGSVVTGPATTALPSYASATTETGVQVTIP